MPKLSLFKPQFMGRTLANRRRRAAGVIQRAYRAGRRYKKGLYRQPKAGGRATIVPLKFGYQYTVQGSSSSSVPIDQEIGLQYMANPDFFNRWYPIFDWVKINKVRVEITCPTNIGQAGIGNGSMFRVWSKKAASIAETPPTNNSEWLSLQNAKRTTFNSKTNSVNFFFTPFLQSQGATYAQRQLWKQWCEMPSGPTGAVPHAGIIAHIVRMDGGNLETTDKFNVNVTMYCQFKGIKQL
jgi:hypothetical protein